MTNKFQTFFEKPYEEIKAVLARAIKDKYKILDLGCNNGNLEQEIDGIARNCWVYCVDNDSKALEQLKSRKYHDLGVGAINQDANTFLVDTKLQGLDAILINATLHEINDVKNQSQYLDFLFGKASDMLGDNGQMIIGDYFYPADVTESEVEAYKEHQLNEIGHADAREKFVSPELIIQKALENGFSLEYSNSLRAVEQINRRYLSFIFKKLKGEK
jgi:SAM-dependent methyltransferase